jgi:chemotaxis protein MotA
MDILTIVGLVMSIGAILVGNIMEGGHTSSLVQPTAFLIVFGGTVGAVMVQTPLQTFLLALRTVVWVVLPPAGPAPDCIEKVVRWSQVARKEGLLGLESIIETETDDFSKKGLQLLVDGNEPETIRGILEVQLTNFEHNYNQVAKVYEGLGGYCPTVGIIGAVMGLIHVMANLSDPSKLGSGIAVAFVATIYGVGLANLIFLPFAGKLKACAHGQTQVQEMILEGIISISQGENPRSIESRLQSFLH